MFSFHLSDCLVFRKKKKNKPHLWTTRQCCAYGLSVTNPPETKWLETILFFFSPSSLVFSLGRAQSSCSRALAGVARAVSRLAETLGWLGLSLQVLWPLLHVAAPSGLASRVAGPLTWQLRAPQAIRQ